MKQFVIRGGIPLHGTMTPSGNKNAALPLMAASLLTDEPIVLHNMPNIIDTQTMSKLMASLGVQVDKLDEPNSYRFTAKNIHAADLDRDLARKSVHLFYLQVQ